VLTAQWFVGIDWASEAHEVCILDREGRVHERRKVPHTATGLQAFVDALLQRAGGDPSSVAIGIETPRGTVVELCVERGFGVYAINPKQLDRFRDRFTPAGAKDDSRDALVIGDSLRTDPQAFRRVRLDHPLIFQLREWSRLDEELGLAAYHWARTGAQKDPASRVYYGQLRARGHSHARALRSIADRLLRVLVALLNHRQLFDAAQGHQSPLAVAVGA
jgi:Transposase